MNDFEKGYRFALRRVSGLRHQHWSDAAKPEIDKLFAQIHNCIEREAGFAEGDYVALKSALSRARKRRAR